MKICPSIAKLLPLIFGVLLFVKTAQAQDLAVQVERFEVVGNSLLTPSQLQQTLPDAKGSMTLLEIQKVAQKLQEAYRVAGFGAVVVQVPQQVLTNGVVTLEVIEGKLSQIQVAGIRDFSKDNILRALPALASGTTPLLSDLDSELLMVNENPAKSVRVVFQPGEKKGQVEALVVVEEQPIVRTTATLDNTGNPSTGRYRLAVGYQNANFRDNDSVLGLRYITSPSNLSQVSILSATLRVPLYAQKTFLEWSALASNTRNAPNQTPAGELRFSGKGVSLGARAIWTLSSLNEYKHQVSAGLESRRYRNNCELGDLGSAGCGTAAASVDVFPFTLSYVLQKPGALQLNASWVNNLPVARAGKDADFNAARPGAVSGYSILRGNALGVLPLTQDWSLTWRADVQASRKALVSAEQFGIGGASSVRGYPERALSGDSGAVASIEVRTLLPNPFADEKSAQAQSLYFSLFVDSGAVSNKLNTSCVAGKSTCKLWGTGAAVLYRPSKATSLRVDLARAGQTVNDVQAGNWRGHFSLSTSF